MAASKLKKLKNPITWEAVEHIFHPRSATWYTIIVILTIALIAAAIWMRNWWLIAIVVLGLVALATSKANKPTKIPYKISRAGIAIADRHYPFNALKFFWIIYRPPNKSVYFEQARYFAPHLVIRLGSEDPAKVRRILLQHLPESTGRGEDMFDRVSRWLHF